MLKKTGISRSEKYQALNLWDPGSGEKVDFLNSFHIYSN